MKLRFRVKDFREIVLKRSIKIKILSIFLLENLEIEELIYFDDYKYFMEKTHF